MQKIRDFFKVNSNYQLFMVNLVFAVTGSTALYLADIILINISFIENTSSKALYWSVRIFSRNSTLSGIINFCSNHIWRIQIFLEYRKKNVKKAWFQF